MTVDEEDFVFNLMANTKIHEEWIAVVKFGLRTLLESQSLLAEVLVAEAMREANKITTHKPSDEIARILSELGLRLSLTS